MGYRIYRKCLLATSLFAHKQVFWLVWCDNVDWQGYQICMIDKGKGDLSHWQFVEILLQTGILFHSEDRTTAFAQPSK